MEKMHNDELISALADGELRGDELARAVALAAGDAAARRTWHAYQAVGEVLRSGQAAPARSDSEAFLAAVRVKLQAQPLQAPEPAALAAIVTRSEPAANDWRWKLVAGVASVAAVAAIGWNLAGPALTPAAQPQLAAAPVPAPASARAEAPQPEAVQQAAMIRDPRLDRLLAAHRQLGGATAWQSTSGFLRNATYEGPAR
jgi:sigma-E factor negative regulatory protein RseA